MIPSRRAEVNSQSRTQDRPSHQSTGSALENDSVTTGAGGAAGAIAGHVFFRCGNPPDALPYRSQSLPNAFRGIVAMLEQRSKPNFAEYLTVGEAAEYLGVSPWTLRNWDKAGRLKPMRHPKNGYRIYRHQDLAAVLESAVAPAPQNTCEAVNWSDISECEHFVQFYEQDDFLISSMA